MDSPFDLENGSKHLVTRGAGCDKFLGCPWAAWDLWELEPLGPNLFRSTLTPPQRVTPCLLLIPTMGNGNSKPAVGAGLVALAAVGTAAWAYQQVGAKDKQKQAAAATASQQGKQAEEGKTLPKGSFKKVCDGDSCRLVWEPEGKLPDGPFQKCH